MTRVPDRYVVDTGVFVRWFLRQVGSEHAREVRAAFLSGEVGLETVDSVRVELAHVLRTQGLLTGQLDRTTYLIDVRALDDLGVVMHGIDVDALEAAAALAADRNLRLFDALVVRQALAADLPLLTSDAKLVRAVGGLLSTELLRGT